MQMLQPIKEESVYEERSIGITHSEEQRMKTKTTKTSLRELRGQSQGTIK